MVNVAVLGYGVVGSGVVEVIKKNGSSISKRAGEEITVKKVLDIRDFKDSPDQEILTKNSEDVFEDDSISIVVETIGGIGVAYEFTKRALKLKKHVVTSNKELVATHGPELLRLAKEMGVKYLFEASVGGGIPIIRPLYQCLAANEINGITGILNGTTNYILTQMKREGKDFAVALKGAQDNGYAEADPTADIEGHDACRKIAILSSIAYNEFVDYKHIYTEGITKITLNDMKYADEMDSVIKLIAMSMKINDKIFARVTPAIISKSHPLANVEDVFNAIVVKGDAIGDAMFYGRGAGKLPTASAVVADVIDIVKHVETRGKSTWTVTEENNTVHINDVETKYFIRIKVRNQEEAHKYINKTFGSVEWVKVYDAQLEDEIAFVTLKDKERNLKALLEEMKGIGSIREVTNVIRVLEE
ncbi:MAG: homoserine dehydrogenase [Clostridia bacterium]|nr:homoserine dehydrogenase [Clostridia bacterium]